MPIAVLNQPTEVPVKAAAQPVPIQPSGQSRLVEAVLSEGQKPRAVAMIITSYLLWGLLLLIISLVFAAVMLWMTLRL